MKELRDYLRSEAGQTAIAKIWEENRRSIEMISQSVTGIGPIFVDNSLPPLRVDKGEALQQQPADHGVRPGQLLGMTVEELKVALAGPWPPTAKDFAYEITFRGQILRKSEMFGRASELVSDVEVRLRNVVAYKLEAVAGPKWLKQRSGSAIFGRVTQLKAAAVKRGTVDVRPLAYATLGELKEIIIRRDNWSECFSEVFGDQDDFRLNLGRLIFLRNEVAHSRPIAHDEFVELLTVSKRIIRLINADSSRRRAAELLQAIIG